MTLGLRGALRHVDHLQFVGDACDSVSALQIIGDVAPDLALVDLRLGESDGARLTAQIRVEAPACRVIGLSAIENPVQIAAMVRAGARGFVLKSQPISELLEAIEVVHAGRLYLPPLVPRDQIDAWISTPSPFERLTSREHEVLRVILEGGSSAEVARQLLISPRTAESHRQHIMAKVGCHSVIELNNLARVHGVGSV